MRLSMPSFHARSKSLWWGYPCLLCMPDSKPLWCAIFTCKLLNLFDEVVHVHSGCMPWLHARSYLGFHSERGWSRIRCNRHLFSFIYNSSSWCAQYCNWSECQAVRTATAARGSLSSSTNLMVSTWIFVVDTGTRLFVKSGSWSESMCLLEDTITKSLILITRLNNNLRLCCFLLASSLRWHTRSLRIPSCVCRRN